MNGFPVGEECAFTRVALRSLQQFSKDSACVLPLANLRSGPQILTACRELRPDVVVLQLGHYEAPAQLRKSLGLRGAKLKGTEKISIDGAPAPRRPRPEMQYRLTPWQMIWELRRILAAALVIATGKSKKMFNSKSIAASLDSILANLKEVPLRGIVVIGPFSAPDPVVRFFRRRAVPIFEKAAKKHGCTFVDVFAMLETYPKGKAFRSNFADSQHLSVLGHKRVGAMVGAALGLAMENATAEEEVCAARIEQESRISRPKWSRQPLTAPRSPSVGAA
jgi:hypothetical protein